MFYCTEFIDRNRKCPTYVSVPLQKGLLSHLMKDSLLTPGLAPDYSGVTITASKKSYWDIVRDLCSLHLDNDIDEFFIEIHEHARLFLESNRWIISPIIQMMPVLKTFFKNADFSLQLFVDPEEGYEELFIGVYNYDDNNSHELLNKFDDEWLIKELQVFRNKLNVIII